MVVSAPGSVAKRRVPLSLGRTAPSNAESVQFALGSVTPYAIGGGQGFTVGPLLSGRNSGASQCQNGRNLLQLSVLFPTHVWDFASAVLCRHLI